jgi:hypothetical protein
MIVERRRQIRKCFVNYAGSPTAGEITVVKPDVAKQKPVMQEIEDNDRYENYTAFSFDSTTAPDWDDDSMLTTNTTPSVVVYAYALLTILAFFAIGYNAI